MTVNFSELGISEDILRAIEDMGWTEPTPIQCEAVPAGIEGSDLLAQAQTGTGKTGAYGSILLNNSDAEGGWATSLVLTPTRELALQVTEEMERLAKYTGHKCVAVYGGVSMLKQTQELERGVDIIIATPGRLVDHLKDDERLLGNISTVVLDEADRMLDMGFRKELEFILRSMPSDRQTMMFSATMADNVRDLALKHLYEPKEVCVSKDEPVLDLIDQKCMFVEKDDKIEMLRYVLAKEPMKTIVFCFTKYRVDKVVRKLKMSFRLAGIHGDITQNRREEILRKFREGKIDVLVASDLAARGLDIENVGRIINLDLPIDPETYVHRIGRTGRAGKNGIALSFVMHDEKKLLNSIENTTLIPIEVLDTPDQEEFDRVCGSIRELSRPVIAKKNSRKNDVPVSEKEFVLAEMNIGKADGQGKASISQLLRDYTSVPKKSIGNIRPNEKTTVLEVEKKYLGLASEGMAKCTINGKTVKMWAVAETDAAIDDTIEVSAPAPKENVRSDRRPKERPRYGDSDRSYRENRPREHSRYSDSDRNRRDDRHREDRPRESRYGDSGRDLCHDDRRSNDRLRYNDSGRSSYRDDRHREDRPRESRYGESGRDYRRDDRRSNDRPRYGDSGRGYHNDDRHRDDRKDYRRDDRGQPRDYHHDDRRSGGYGNRRSDDRGYSGERRRYSDDRRSENDRPRSSRPDRRRRPY